MGWLAAVDYRQGKRDTGLRRPCRDYGLVGRPRRGRIVGALADGSTTARLGHVGARAAVESATAALQKRAQDDAPAGREAMESALSEVRASLRQEAGIRRCDPQDLATRLLAFSVSENGIAVLRIGMGFLISGGPARAYHCIGQSAPGVTPAADVTDPEAPAEICIENGPVTFIVAGTEALRPVSVRADDGRPQTRFIHPLYAYMSSAESDDEIHLGIRQFLRSDQLAPLVENDAGLMLCSWRADHWSGSPNA